MALVDAAQAGDTEAMALLAKDNLGLVRAAARRFTGTDLEELFQAGCLGLVEAIRRFDSKRGVRFSTYAVPYILGEMKRFIREDRALRVPRSMLQTARAAHQAAETLRRRNDREPTLIEISVELAIPPEELAMALSSQNATLSLDRPVGESEENTLQDTLSDERQKDALERVLLQALLEQCSARERTLLSLRYERGLSQADTARVLGLSQPQVSRLEKQALSRLRQSAAGE